MESIWSATTSIRPFPALDRDRKTTVAVIGGGLAGILTAYCLAQRGIETIVLEAARIGDGQTKNTTAKITSQHDLIYRKLLQGVGEELAKQYAAANQNAIAAYHRIISEQGISCEFEERPAFLYSTRQQGVLPLEQEAAAAQAVGISAHLTKQTSLPFPVSGAIRFDGQAQFHPLKFLQAIAKKLTIFENTRALLVKGKQVLTPHGTVTAEHIVFATHFPFVNAPGFYFARMHQERSYVVALENAAKLDGMYLGIDADGLSFRNSGNLLLLGGGSHRTGENSEGGKYDMLREKAAAFYPDGMEIAHWSAQDCMTLDSIPYIGPFSSATPNWYVATGFGKWGMTSSMVSAMLLTDQITHTPNPYSEVFSPQRFTPSASIQAFLSDSAQAVKGIARQVFTLPEETGKALAAGHGGIVEVDGQKIGVYRNEEGECFFVSTRCPHLGCQLEWNPDEKSWDCPCHGSRFDYRGKLIDNPAQEDIK